MVNKILSRVKITRNLTEEMKIIYLYRYFSLIITSFFYIIDNQQAQFGRKLFIITCLSISSVILNHLYAKSNILKSTIKVLVIIETVGNILILIPSGGLNSPYMLYSLNTLLITLYYLNIYYCLADLLIYLLVSTGVSIKVFYLTEKNIISLLLKNSNLIISFILIITAAQMLFNLTKKINKESKNLTKVNGELKQANEGINESVKYIMSLYQAVNSLTNINNKSNLITLITHYAKEIGKSPMAFFYAESKEQNTIQTSENVGDEFKSILVSGISREWQHIKELEIPASIIINEKAYLMIGVRSTQSFYGVLGMEINTNNQDTLIAETVNQLKFVSALSSITLERFELEEINEHLLISEEQNRIAREIHDSVCQRIFALSCILYTLKKKSNSISPEDLNRELEFVNDSLNSINKELRVTIYNLSWKNRQSTAFQEDIERYINEISRLNNVKVDFNISGSQDLLSYDMKRAIYRIISEGAGNAIRHGKCRNIIILIDIHMESIRLSISDNGIGFDMENKSKNKEMGLGIKNINNLVYYFSGELSIESQPGKGTFINIIFPGNIAAGKNKEEVV